LLLIPLTIALALAGPKRPNKRRFWLGLALRSFLLLLLILAISGFQINLKTDVLTTIFLLDVSDSIPVKHQEQAENIIRLAIQDMPPSDRAAVILFGKDALVETLVSEENSLPDFSSVPVTSQTNIADALQLALALFPGEGAKRIVLLSDGQENLGFAFKQAEFVAANRVELLYYPIQGGSEDIEVLLDGLRMPSNVRVGEQIQLNAVVISNSATSGILNIFQDGQLIDSREVDLIPGTNDFSLLVEAEESGFHQFRAQILPAVDFRLQNNEANAFITVYGPRRVLIVEGDSGEGQNLADALSSAELLVDVYTSPTDMGNNLQAISDYDTVIFVNVPAKLVPPGIMEALPIYVRDLGKGFIMVGGQNSFGAGGNLRTPIEEILPVNMDVTSKTMTANLALILAIDKSGSMGRCHCDDPDLNQSYSRQEVGQPKVDIAKEAVMRSASALGQDDYLGVVTFDGAANWALQAAKLASFSVIENAIGGITANGQTNVGSGVEAAYEALQGIDAKRKHIILLTDGWSQTGNITQMVEEIAADGITLSVIAAGGGSAEYLEAVSEIGNGRYYPAEDILSVPDIFLKETVQSVGEYIIEEPFYPLPINPGAALNGIDAFDLPVLFGYNGTSPKTAARLDLTASSGDPLLATWQHGLGRTAAWTSDLKGQWGEQWVTWDHFPRFSAQLVSWVLPEPTSEFFQATAVMKDNQGHISLTIRDEFGKPINFAQANAIVVRPDLVSDEVQLEQTGQGEYSGVFEVDLTGTYMIRIGANDENFQSLGQQTVGLVIPYSPEYRASELDLATLVQLSEITGGGELVSPGEAFIHNLPSASFAIEIWRKLLLAVALLFPLDVAIRRLIFDREDMLKAWNRVGNLFNRTARKQPDEPRVLKNLFEARDRARKAGLIEKPELDQVIEKREPVESVEEKSTTSTPQNQDTLARLRQAKKRAKKDRKEE
jgi:uncharacterized membrane protein